MTMMATVIMIIAIKMIYDGNGVNDDGSGENDYSDSNAHDYAYPK